MLIYVCVAVCDSSQSCVVVNCVVVKCGELSWVSICPEVNCLVVNCVVVKCLVVNCVVLKCGELSWVSIYPVGKLPGSELCGGEMW